MIGSGNDPDEAAARNSVREHHSEPNGPFMICPPSTGVRGLHFTGLERGKDWFSQIRAIGPNGPGPWSDPAMMMVV